MDIMGKQAFTRQPVEALDEIRKGELHENDPEIGTRAASPPVAERQELECVDLGRRIGLREATGIEVERLRTPDLWVSPYCCVVYQDACVCWHLVAGGERSADLVRVGE